VSRSSLVLLTLVLVLGCESETITVGTHATTPPTAVTRPAPAPAPIAAETPDAGPAALVLEDRDFVEAETNRDPFRSYADSFAARPTSDPVQIDIIMEDTPVDDIGLIAIISGVANPSAMLTDTAGVGHTVHRGDHVARPEVVTAGEDEGIAVTLVWRVDRIRAGEVVLTREDPTAPDRPPLTRVLDLHEGEDEEGGITEL
jgi:type IV pilus assembly protein PilP